ncbi:MAG: MarR family winged helix-turn-helix transcriptional regulator [Thermomicrobiales bacterium]
MLVEVLMETKVTTGEDGGGVATRSHGDLGWALGMLLRSYHAYVDAVIGEFPHGPRGYQLLSTVVCGDQPNQLALATHLGIDRTVMTYLIDDLVTAGLVERQQDPNDRRARKVVATPAGEQRLNVLQRRVREAEQKVLGVLSPAEQEQFSDLINRIAVSVRHISPETDPCVVATEMLDEKPTSSPSSTSPSS